jgi:hypothetical protein
MRSFKSFMLLVEHDMDKTWDNYGEKINNRMFDELVGPLSDHTDLNKKHFAKNVAHVDPTPHGEYHQWIAKHYATGGINKFEDLHSRVKPALERFHQAKIQRKLSAHDINPDINAHKGLPALEAAVDKLPEQMKSKRQVKDTEATKHDEEHWTIVIPHTENAAAAYGANTKWCTAADEHSAFHDYNNMGHLHILIPKKPAYPGEKYQHHLTAGDGEIMMNEKDHEVPITSHHSLNSLQTSIFDKRPSPYVQSQSKHMNDLQTRLHYKDATEANTEKYAIHPNPAFRNLIARHGFHHGKFVHDPNPEVRELVANSSAKYHDTLVNDPHVDVQMAVAQRSTNPKHIETLAHSSSESVRNEIADKHELPSHIALHLANDKSEYVRAAIATHSYMHDDEPKQKIIEHLKNDPSFMVKTQLSKAHPFDIELHDHLRKDANKFVANYSEHKYQSLKASQNLNLDQPFGPRGI